MTSSEGLQSLSFLFLIFSLKNLKKKKEEAKVLQLKISKDEMSKMKYKEFFNI